MELGTRLLALPHGSLPYHECVHNLFPRLFLHDDCGAAITDGEAAESFQMADRLGAAALKRAGEAYAGMMSGDAQFRGRSHSTSLTFDLGGRIGERNMASPIFVTGAAGRVGAVGRTVTEPLLTQGKAVRATVRNEDVRAQALRDPEIQN